MRNGRTVLLIVAVLFSTAACSSGQSPNFSTSPPASSSTTSWPDSSMPSTTITPRTTPHPQGAAVLRQIHTGKHQGYERVVFEFFGATPTHQASYVPQVTEDGSGKPVPLRGKNFVQLTMHGATMDNSFQVTDPSHILRYTGPKRMSPNFTLVQELAAAGDFEADLSFGIGLARHARLHVSTLTNPNRVVIDFFA